MRILLFVVSVFFITSSAFADSPVWKVSKGDQHFYLGGTMHLLQSSDYPLPEQFDKAFARADIAVFEADETQMNSPQAQQALLQNVVYQDGSTIKDKVSDETFAQLQKFFASRGLPMQQFMTMKPSMFSVMLTVMESQALGYTEKGVDSYFADKARQQGKGLDYLETVEQQISFISAMGEGNEDAFMRYTLDDLAELEASLKMIKSAWRGGNFDKLENDALKEMREQFPDVYAIIINDRNRAWMPKLNGYLQTDPVEVVLVGALHLAGPDGLLALLAEQGYTLEELH